MKGPQPNRSRDLLPELASVAGHVMWRASARASAAIEDLLPAEVDMNAYAVLLALADEESGSQQRLADTVSVSRTTMTKVAADLASQGLVERVRNPADRRSYALTRTRAGAGAVGTWRRHVNRVEDDLTAGFTLGERAELRRLLLAVARPVLSPHTPQPLLGSVWFLLTRIHARLHAEILEALRYLGVEPRHLGSLLVIETRGPVAQAELARFLGISGPSVVEIVDHLEHRGLVERRRLEADRRAQVLHLLPDPHGIAREARDRAGEVSDARLSPLGKRQRSRLIVLLGRLITGG